MNTGLKILTTTTLITVSSAAIANISFNTSNASGNTTQALNARKILGPSLYNLIKTHNNAVHKYPNQFSHHQPTAYPSTFMFPDRNDVVLHCFAGKHPQHSGPTVKLGQTGIADITVLIDFSTFNDAAKSYVRHRGRQGARFTCRTMGDGNKRLAADYVSHRGSTVRVPVRIKTLVLRTKQKKGQFTWTVARPVSYTHNVNK